jgi:serine/threonine protein kinase
VSPDQVGPYRLQWLIGRGGMGEVYNAFDTVHDRYVALKLLNPDTSADPAQRDRFKRESHVVARLRDPHVIPVHSFGELDGRLFIDMRLVDGPDLAAVLEDGPLSPARAVTVIEQVASALDAAHDEGLIHRDVKPSNILVAHTPSGADFAYLVDFGISRALAGGGTVTRAGEAAGTLAYMAPERFVGAPPDPQMDVYSLACVLFECLTGAKPFAGDTLPELVNAHVNTPPPRPSAVVPVPREFDAVIGRGMAKDPGLRYASPGQLATAARSALSGRTAALPRRRTRKPLVIAAAALAAGLLVGGLVWLTSTSTPHRPPQPSSPPAGFANFPQFTHLTGTPDGSVAAYRHAACTRRSSNRTLPGLRDYVQCSATAPSFSFAVERFDSGTAVNEYVTQGLMAANHYVQGSWSVGGTVRGYTFTSPISENPHQIITTICGLPRFVVVFLGADRDVSAARLERLWFASSFPDAPTRAC